MATKIVQTVNRISPTNSSVSSNPISLKSGYIRVSAANTGAYVAIGTDPVATINSFHLTTYGSEVIKERIARQQIAGISTGSTTTVSLFENAGNPFKVGDYVTIEGSNVILEHKHVTSITDFTITIDHDSSAVSNVTTAYSTLSRSVKVAAISSADGSDISIAEVVQLVSE
jgi:hypothetical protein